MFSSREWGCSARLWCRCRGSHRRAVALTDERPSPPTAAASPEGSSNVDGAVDADSPVTDTRCCPAYPSSAPLPGATAALTPKSTSSYGCALAASRSDVVIWTSESGPGIRQASTAPAVTARPAMTLKNSPRATSAAPVPGRSSSIASYNERVVGRQPPARHRYAANHHAAPSTHRPDWAAPATHVTCGNDELSSHSYGP